MEKCNYPLYFLRRLKATTVAIVTPNDTGKARYASSERSPVARMHIQKH